MSVFGAILSKIFHGAEAATPASTATSTSGTGAAAAQGAGAGPTTGASSSGASATPAPTQTTATSQDKSAPAAPSAGAAPVDVAAVLDGLAARNSQTLDWKHSIVDMMKLLDLDSSLTSRKSLAEELHYTGDMGDSAAMNLWLHKQVMQKLAENGGKVPADLQA